MDVVAQLRRFNRTVTQRVGALDDEFLGRSLPLGQARVLWEIGPDRVDVRVLRSRLELDSGYLSRLLGSLSTRGLVALEPSAADRRVRTVRRTAAGEAEIASLDQRADQRAEDILQPLSDRQRARLAEAMAEVERLLTASAVRIAPADPRHRDAQWCLAQYFAELAARFEGGFDPARSLPAAAVEMSPPAGLFLVATGYGAPVGCGGLKLHGDEPAEIKRMWFAPAVRGLGLGRRMLAELEAHAVAGGARQARLETNHTLGEAIALYRATGYQQVAPFNDEPYADHWFVKELVRPG
jgi:DNA-binding MarR family transcriptional regulator/GNAT superfamily N-acetyltransferase